MWNWTQSSELQCLACLHSELEGQLGVCLVGKPLGMASALARSHQPLPETAH